MSVNGIKSSGISVAVEGSSFEELMSREWLLTNSRGSFSSGSLAGCNSRRYHGLLIGSVNPPANRVVGLSMCMERVTSGEEEVDLGTAEFDGIVSPRGYRYLTGFRKDIGVHFDYDLGAVKLSKSVYLFPDTDAAALVYEFSNVYRELDFGVRPFTAMRDFHSLSKSTKQLYSEWHDDGLSVSNFDLDGSELFLRSDEMWFEADSQWWYRFLYRKEKERGQGCFEDLWSPGEFKCHINSPCRVILWASFAEKGQAAHAVETDIETIIDSLYINEKEILGKLKNTDGASTQLSLAASQFVIEREIDEKPSWTILAGYPWFLDWGRDAFISLPGLLLETGRLKEAGSVLSTFASAVDEGMIPNRFDDYGGQAHYNSIDSSLWYVNSVFAYLAAGGNEVLFGSNLLPAVRWIIDSYYEGTRFGIHADDDGLITGGDANTQLTWMDAKFEKEVFTPRHGKAVEVNALWYNGLCNLRDYYAGRDDEAYVHYLGLAERVKESFVRAFWNEDKGYLNDCVGPDGSADSSLRPNQIFAVSLKHCPLDAAKQLKVVGVVEKELLTPYGLRTLSRGDGHYQGRYHGSQKERDRAYHQGTVWAFLIGPFIEAYLKVHEFSRESREISRRYLSGLLEHLVQDGCIGSVSEIFDGDPPFKPKGCFAQAWSVAEVLRAYKMINRIKK